MTIFRKVSGDTCAMIVSEDARKENPISVQINGTPFHRLSIAQAERLGRALQELAALALHEQARLALEGKEG